MRWRRAVEVLDGAPRNAAAWRKEQIRKERRALDRTSLAYTLDGVARISTERCGARRCCISRRHKIG
jgi:hypothetical protein